MYTFLRSYKAKRRCVRSLPAHRPGIPLGVADPPVEPCFSRSVCLLARSGKQCSLLPASLLNLCPCAAQSRKPAMNKSCLEHGPGAAARELTSHWHGAAQAAAQLGAGAPHLASHPGCSPGGCLTAGAEHGAHAAGSPGSLVARATAAAAQAGMRFWHSSWGVGTGAGARWGARGVRSSAGCDPAGCGLQDREGPDAGPAAPPAEARRWVAALGLGALGMSSVALWLSALLVRLPHAEPH